MIDFLFSTLRALSFLGGAFTVSAFIGAGLHCGRLAAARWFGPVTATVVTFQPTQPEEGAAQ